MPARNAFYAQSGGVTAVINATAASLIEAARGTRRIARVYAGRNGILGALREELFDTGAESRSAIAALRHTPGGAFGSCRYKLPPPAPCEPVYERLSAVFRAHGIGYFFYNGGGDSQDTADKVAGYFEQVGHPLCCIGIPKTIDNDLPGTDNCPGFGSVAKYVAVSVREAALDVASMCATSTQVFLLEVMGRHSGWIAAAGGLAADRPGEAPQIILFPERPFAAERFLAAVSDSVARRGYCVVVASEGLRDAAGGLLSAEQRRDAFGHSQLGGVAPRLAALVTSRLGFKCHWAVADYLQRSARHLASAVDLEQAEAMGRAAVEFALAGQHRVMPIIRRLPGHRYRWEVAAAPLSSVANVERQLPRSYIRRDGFGITARARAYLQPLIQGEAYPPYRDGLPLRAHLKLRLVRKKLPPWDGGP